ncbi:alpha/beta-hydrolase [Viridothelium virens]|uniref:Alpha/beta-hydrolase n=1 Tax=Viridothelium virens TaxID=1048519 RepID=A0A6A6HGW9_VIRVR|nr:alpha/beta-hydrolase [Viridothelium virens]
MCALRLSQDEFFYFEMLRNIGHASYHEADISEVLRAAGQIARGDIESFYSAFFALAERTASQAKRSEPTTLSGKRHTLEASGFSIPIIFYSAAAEPDAKKGPRPTLIADTGFDGTQEEMFHVIGFAALRRGWNVITYEGPGQPSRVVTPVVDWAFAQAKALDIDTGKLGLWGESMGSYLAPRAAAFEHRVAAVFAVDGVFDCYQPYSRFTRPKGQEPPAERKAEEFNAYIRDLLRDPNTPTAARWGIGHGLWSFSDGDAGSMRDSTEPMSPYDFMAKVKNFTLLGLEDKIQCPVLEGHAENDLFFAGQPELLAEALSKKATMIKLTDADGAGEHCHSGAGILKAQVMLDWFQKVVIDKN